MPTCQANVIDNDMSHRQLSFSSSVLFFPTSTILLRHKQDKQLYLLSEPVAEGLQTHTSLLGSCGTQSSGGTGLLLAMKS